MKTESFLQFFVAGVVYTEFHKAKLKRGLQLNLIKEPTNPVDGDAIAVYAGKVKIGYVPRDLTMEIHEFSGRVTKAVIRQYCPTNATHCMILVDVFGQTHGGSATKLKIC